MSQCVSGALLAVHCVSSAQ